MEASNSIKQLLYPHLENSRQMIWRGRAGALLGRAVAALYLCLGSEAARADALDTLNLTLAETLRHDNNLFRLPEGRQPSSAAGNSSRSDVIRTEAVTLTLDKQLSMQKVHFSATVSTNRFRTFDSLNYQSKGYEGFWSWQLTPHLRGRIFVQRAQTLNSFADIQGFQRNVRTSSTRRLDADYGVFGKWRLTASLSEGQSRNSAPFVQIGDTRTQAAAIGVRYVTLADNWVALTSSLSEVDWMNRPLDLVNHYDVSAEQRDAELRVKWQITGKSMIDGVVDWVTRRHANVPSRNYKGTAGRLDYTWAGSGKAQLRVGVGRDFEPWWESSSSYARRDRLTFSPVWYPSARTQVRLHMERSTRDYLGPVPGYSGGVRSDSGSLAELAFEWAPTRNLTLATSLQSEGRNSNQPGLDYEDKTLMFSAQLAF